MEDEIKVNSGSSEPPQVPNTTVDVTPTLTMTSVGAASAESSLGSTRSGATEEFRRKVAQADTQPVQPMSEESSKFLLLESEPTPAALTHMGTPMGGSTVNTVSQQLPLSETTHSAENGISRPSDVMQPEKESTQRQRNVETKMTEGTKETERGGADSSLAGPSSLVAEALESATGEKSVCEVRMRDEKIGRSLAAVSEKGEGGTSSTLETVTPKAGAGSDVTVADTATPPVIKEQLNDLGVEAPCATAPITVAGSMVAVERREGTQNDTAMVQKMQFEENEQAGLPYPSTHIPGTRGNNGSLMSSDDFWLMRQMQQDFDTEMVFLVQQGKERESQGTYNKWNVGNCGAGLSKTHAVSASTLCYTQ